MRKILPTSTAAIALLGVVAIMPARAQTVFDVPGEVIGGAMDTGEVIVGGVTRPIAGPYYGRHYYGPAPVRVYTPPPAAVQCGIGIGCRYYSAYPYYMDQW